jgi:hypothetical protein
MNSKRCIRRWRFRSACVEFELEPSDELLPSGNSEVEGCDISIAWKSPSILNLPFACSEVAITSEGTITGEESRAIWGPNGAKSASDVSSDGSIVAAEDIRGQGNVTSYTGSEIACVVVDGPVDDTLEVS